MGNFSSQDTQITLDKPENQSESTYVTPKIPYANDSLDAIIETYLHDRSFRNNIGGFIQLKQYVISNNLTDGIATTVGMRFDRTKDLKYYLKCYLNSMYPITSEIEIVKASFDKITGLSELVTKDFLVGIFTNGAYISKQLLKLKDEKFGEDLIIHIMRRAEINPNQMILSKKTNVMIIFAARNHMYRLMEHLLDNEAFIFTKDDKLIKSPHNPNSQVESDIGYFTVFKHYRYSSTICTKIYDWMHRYYTRKGNTHMLEKIAMYNPNPVIEPVLISGTSY